jgi:hypothetical protein
MFEYFYNLSWVKDRLDYLVGRITVRSPASAIGRGLEPLDVRTDPEPDSTGDKNQK